MIDAAGQGPISAAARQGFLSGSPFLEVLHPRFDV